MSTNASGTFALLTSQGARDILPASVKIPVFGIYFLYTSTRAGAARHFNLGKRSACTRRCLTQSAPTPRAPEPANGYLRCQPATSTRYKTFFLPPRRICHGSIQESPSRTRESILCISTESAYRATRVWALSKSIRDASSNFEVSFVDPLNHRSTSLTHQLLKTND